MPSAIIEVRTYIDKPLRTVELPLVTTQVAPDGSWIVDLPVLSRDEEHRVSVTQILYRDAEREDLALVSDMEVHNLVPVPPFDESLVVERTFTVLESVGQFTITIAVSPLPMPGESVFVPIETLQRNNTAAGGVDFRFDFGELEFTAETATQAVIIIIENDDIFEIDETFTLLLSIREGTVAEADRRFATDVLVVIEDDDTASVTFGATSYTVEQTEGGSTLDFTIGIPRESIGVSTGDLILNVSTRELEGGARAGQDYTPLDETVILNVNNNEQTLSLNILDDSVVEERERLVLVISSPDNRIGDVDTGLVAEAIVTIEPHISTHLFECEDPQGFLGEHAELISGSMLR